MTQQYDLAWLYKILEYPSACTHQESTQKVLMLENVTRTHEYSDLLSTRRSYSWSTLSIWVRQRTTRMILFHSRVRRLGAFFKVRHSDFLGLEVNYPPRSRADFRRVYCISSPSSGDRDTLENFWILLLWKISARHHFSLYTFCFIYLLFLQ